MQRYIRNLLQYTCSPYTPAAVPVVELVVCVLELLELLVDVDWASIQPGRKKVP